MFEGCLVESRGMAVSSTQRWTALGSLTFQLAVAGLLIAIPLVRPQALPTVSAAPQLELPLPMRPPVPVVQTRTAGISATTMSVPAAAPQMAAYAAVCVSAAGRLERGDLRRHSNRTCRSGWEGRVETRRPWVRLPTGSGPAVAVVREKAPGPVHVSGGVTEGMLLSADSAGVSGDCAKRPARRARW